MNNTYLLTVQPTFSQAHQHQLSTLIKRNTVLPYLSISHSYSLIISCQSKQPVGIDLEYIRPRSTKLQTYIINENRLLSHHIKDSNEITLVAWIIKESCYKVLSEGNCPSDLLITSYNNDTFTVTSNKHKYRGTIYHTVPEYLFAIAHLIN